MRESSWYAELLSSKSALIHAYRVDFVGLGPVSLTSGFAERSLALEVTSTFLPPNGIMDPEFNPSTAQLMIVDAQQRRLLPTRVSDLIGRAIGPWPRQTRASPGKIGIERYALGTLSRLSPPH